MMDLQNIQWASYTPPSVYPEDQSSCRLYVQVLNYPITGLYVLKSIQNYL